jgi:hypothetical protein
MQNYAVARGSLKGPRRDGPYDEGFVSFTKLCYGSRSFQLPPLPPHVQKSLDHSDSQSVKSGSTELYSAPSQATSYGQPTSQPETPDTNSYAVLGIPASTGHTFGVDLGAQLERDKVEVPRVLEKCAEAIELFGDFQCCMLEGADDRSREYRYLSSVWYDESSTGSQACSRF